jgi:hypothetical protein
MKNITRRSFITKTLLALSSSTASNLAYANQPVELTDVNTLPKFQHECLIIFKEWEKKEENSPMAFLLNSIDNNVSDELKISELTKIDFQNKKFFSVDGLLLSKTEAAFLALLGSNINY